jgi:hypothetical protein
MIIKLGVSKNLKLLVIICGILVHLISCAPSVKSVETSQRRSPKSNDYEMIYIVGGDRLSENTTTLGNISVYDAGLAINCGLEEVMIKAEEEAKRLGADAIKIIEINPPDFLSTCYRIEAIAIGYNGNDTGKVTYEKLLAPMDILDSAFVEFTDCAECKNYGDIENILNTKRSVLLPAIEIFTVYMDAGESLTNYPITESRMNEHLHLLLESFGWNVNLIYGEESYFDSLSLYYELLLKNLFYNNGNPLDWYIDASFNIEDSTTIIYIPVAIERKAQYSKSGRFYAIIIDNRGKILNYSCLGYDPKLWARNFNKFATDIEDKLPLIKEQVK